MCDRRIYGREVFLNDCVAPLAVSFLDCVLDGFDSFVAWEHAAQGEETCLHDRVDAAAHACFKSHLVSVNYEEAKLLFNDLPLNFARQMIPHFVWPKWCIQ